MKLQKFHLFDARQNLASGANQTTTTAREHNHHNKYRLVWATLKTDASSAILDL